MSPERKRRTVDEVRRRLGPEKVSERRACKVLGQPVGRSVTPNVVRWTRRSCWRRCGGLLASGLGLAALGFTMRLANEVGRSITSE